MSHVPRFKYCRPDCTTDCGHCKGDHDLARRGQTAAAIRETTDAVNKAGEELALAQRHFLNSWTRAYADYLTAQEPS